MVFFSRRGSVPAEPRCLLPASPLPPKLAIRPPGGSFFPLFGALLLTAAFLLAGCVHSSPGSGKKSGLVPNSSTTNSPTGAATQPATRVPGAKAKSTSKPVPTAKAVKAGGGDKRRTDPLAAESDAVIERRAAAHAAFAAAMIQQEESGITSALELFRKSLENDPDNITLAIDLSRRLIERKEREAALEVLKRSAPKAAGTELASTFQSLLGVVYAQLGKREESMAAYREAIRLAPDELINYQALADLQGASGRRAEVGTTLDLAARSNSTDSMYWIELAELFRQYGKRETNSAPRSLAAARASLEKAAALKPVEPGILQRLGERYESVGQPEKAEAVYRELRTRFPKDPRPTGKLAELYLRLGRNKEAGEQLESLKKDNPSNPVPFYYLGLLAFESRDFERAVSHFERSLLLNPEFEPIYADLAAAWLSREKPAEALAVIDKTVGRFAPEFRREYLAGLAQARLQHYDQSLTRFLAAEKAAAEQSPELLDHRFYFQIGAMLEKAGREEECIQYLQKSLKIKPDFDEALNHLGYLWAEKGVRLDEALTMIRAAVKAEPDNPAYLDSLGWVYFKLGKFAEALPPLQRAVKLLNEPDATVLDHLGDVLNALGRKPEARDAWRESEKVEKSDAVRRKIDANP